MSEVDKVDPAYEKWRLNPSPTQYEALGEALLQFVTKRVKASFGLFFDTYEDAIDETILEVFRDISKYDDTKASFSTWVRGIARNNCIDLWRKRNTQAPSLYHDDLEVASDAINPLNVRLDAQKLFKPENLSELEKSVLIMRLKGMSHKEIASALDSTSDAIRKVWSRIILKNRKK